MDRGGMAEVCGLEQKVANLSHSGSVSHWEDENRVHMTQDNTAECGNTAYKMCTVFSDLQFCAVLATSFIDPIVSYDRSVDFSKTLVQKAK
jgi:hypothetical protein